MSLITKLGTLNFSKLPNQVLKTFTTTHKNHIPLFYNADYKRHESRSNSVPCHRVNSFGPIELLQRSVSPSPYLMRRAQISYMSNKLDLIKEWQKSSRINLKERKFSTTLIKNDSKTNTNCSVPNRRFSRLTDAIKNLFSKKSEPPEFSIDKEENSIPNMKMRIVPCRSGRSKLEIAPVVMEEQERLTPKIPYLYNYDKSKLDVHVRPMSNYKDMDDINKQVNALAKKTKPTDFKSKIVEVICPDVDDVEESKTKKAKYVPFQNMVEKVTEPKVDKKSTAPIISVADMCKDIDKTHKSRRRKNTAVPGMDDRHVVTYPVRKSEDKPPLGKIKNKHYGKAKSTKAVDVDHDKKIKMSNYWAKQKPRASSLLSKNSPKVEPCDPHKDSTRELSNVSYDETNPNLTKLPYQNYSIPNTPGIKSVEKNVFSLYESTDTVTMENIAELRKTQTSLKVPNLSQTKALATSHVDVLSTQLLCSNLFATHSSEQYSENLQPYQVKSYLTQKNSDLSDLGVLELSLAHDKENRKVEWEKYKSAIYDLKSKEKAEGKGKLCSANTFEGGNTGVVEESDHESTVSVKSKGESMINTYEELEEESKAMKASTKTSDKENSPSKPITFIKKDYHTKFGSENYYGCRKWEGEANSFCYSTKVRKGGRRGVQKVNIPDKEKLPPEPCKISEIVKRSKMKQGKSLMRHTEWKAVPIKGMKNPIKEDIRIRDEREKYKELIKMRSNSRETKAPEKCILHTPFDEIEEPKPKPKKSKTSTCIDFPNPYDCKNKSNTKVIFTKSSNSTDDCGCVATGTRKPPNFGNKIVDPRENLACPKKKCVQTEECKAKLRKIMHEMEASAERLKLYEKLKRRNKNYNANCDTIRSRRKRS